MCPLQGHLGQIGGEVRQKPAQNVLVRVELSPRECLGLGAREVGERIMSLLPRAEREQLPPPAYGMRWVRGEDASDLGWGGSRHIWGFTYMQVPDPGAADRRLVASKRRWAGFRSKKNREGGRLFLGSVL